jgi:hypothetical protein
MPILLAPGGFNDSMANVNGKCGIREENGILNSALVVGGYITLCTSCFKDSAQEISIFAHFNSFAIATIDLNYFQLWALHSQVVYSFIT